MIGNSPGPQAAWPSHSMLPGEMIGDYEGKTKMSGWSPFFDPKQHRLRVLDRSCAIPPYRNLLEIAAAGSSTCHTALLPPASPAPAPPITTPTPAACSTYGRHLPLHRPRARRRQSDHQPNHLYTIPPGMKLDEIIRLAGSNEPRCIVEGLSRVVAGETKKTSNSTSTSVVRQKVERMHPALKR